jgi:hypothetical protein
MRSMSMEPTGASGDALSAADDQGSVEVEGQAQGQSARDPEPAVPGDSAFDLSMAVSQLASNDTDVRIMLKVLVAQLADVLGDRLVVERSGRFRKSDEIKSVRVTLGDDTLEAAVEGANVRCTVGHSSGGIRIRSQQVGMDGWLTRLLSALQSEAANSERTRLALENLVIGGPS